MWSGRSARRGGAATARDPILDDVEMFKSRLVSVTHDALMDIWRRCVTGMGIAVRDEEDPGWRDGVDVETVNRVAFLRASKDWAAGISYERREHLLFDLESRIKKLRNTSDADVRRLFVDTLTTLQRPIVDKYRMFMEAEARRKKCKGIVRGATFEEFIKSLLTHLSLTPELRSGAYFVAPPDKLDRSAFLTFVIVQTAQDSFVILSSPDRFGESAARRAGVRITDRDRAQRSCARDVYLDFASPAAQRLDWGGTRSRTRPRAGRSRSFAGSDSSGSGSGSGSGSASIVLTRPRRATSVPTSRGTERPAETSADVKTYIVDDGGSGANTLPAAPVPAGPPTPPAGADSVVPHVATGVAP